MNSLWGRWAAETASKWGTASEGPAAVVVVVSYLTSDKSGSRSMGSNWREACLTAKTVISFSSTKGMSRQAPHSIARITSTWTASWNPVGPRFLRIIILRRLKPWSLMRLIPILSQLWTTMMIRRICRSWLLTIWTKTGALMIWCKSKSLKPRGIGVLLRSDTGSTQEILLSVWMNCGRF